MMKKLFTLAAFVLAAAAYGQDSMEKTMEARAREMFRVITLNDPEAWKKFVRENYSKTLIEKPMQARKDTNGGGASGSSSSTTCGSRECVSCRYLTQAKSRINTDSSVLY